MNTPIRSLRTLVLLGVAFGLAVVLGAASPATAHEGPGILTMETDTPTGTSHRYVVRLVWENDGHPAARATTITATPVAPGGAAQTPVTMTAVDDDGRFEGTVDLVEPGRWTVRITSINPVSTMEVPVDVAPPATTTTTAPTTTTADPPPTTDTDTDADEPVDTEDAASRTDDDGGGLGAGAVAAGVLVALALVAAAFFVRSKLRPTATTTDD
jgi:hypothetical protein